ncbi:MAG: hypothetical protein A2020_13630 [Lentisphaerae bacterium GWF2_45_14]|nr:MAG: hypothetical protein A2020_13630 [Lentisphaerae bacterium GWF2_45_14]
MIADGIKLMIVGMGVVFSFLGLMVLVILATAKVLAPFAGILEEKPAEAKASRRQSKKKTGPESGAEVEAVITAAVHQYRKENK